MTDSPADRFIEALGLISQTEGAPRISGQILGLLLLAEEPMSLDEIAESLNISKASASTNTRLLEARGTAVKVARKGSRRDLWMAEPDPQRRVLPALAERFRRHARTVHAIAMSFPPDDDARREKVARFATFYDESADFFDAWSARLTGDSDGPPNMHRDGSQT
ncbi:GbsR/MarR family transcriptional regulator [Pseudooceanicola sp.]|uniref:GbsR/MarR family transcriptional regulator n=1 Tax=Pseudooceanicola sp. TaxID=1914328 RepID=UPI00405A31B9